MTLLQKLEAICEEIFDRWDKDMRSGKLLSALAGRVPGYRADVDAVRAALADDWQPIETAPKDGRMALVYRPLARNSGDEPVAVKRLIGGRNHCWESTVPAGQKATNPTDGACHVTHWMEIPEPPTPPSTSSQDHPK